MGLWNETKKVTLACGADVVVRHVGTPDDPFLYEDIRARYVAALDAARIEARKRLAAEHGSIGAAVEARQERMREAGAAQEHIDALTPAALLDSATDVRGPYKVLVRDLVVAGVEFGGAAGADAYRALYEQHGPEGIKQAASAVMEFNSVKAETGEG